MEFFLFDLVCQFSNVFQHDQPDRMGRNLSARVHICETRSLIFRIELIYIVLEIYIYNYIIIIFPANLRFPTS